MIIKIIVLIFLIFVNALFAASEIAFLSVNKLKLRKEVKENNKKAIKIQKLIDNPSSFLATIQIGITLSGFLASAFAAESFADQISLYLTFLPIPIGVLKGIVLIIVTMILSYFTLVFGELVPKRLAMAYPEKIAYFVVNFITLLEKLTYPFVWFLTKSTNLLSKLFGIKEENKEQITEEEIKLIIADSKDSGVIESHEKDLIFNIFNFNDITLSNIMTPKEKVVAINISSSKKEIMKIIKEHKYTRFPVYFKNINNIIGILNVKDILITHDKNTKFDLKKIIREPFFVYEYEMVDDVFRDMQKQKQGISIVMKNDNELAGVVTIEDAIEEIVGNLFDEYD